MKLKMNKLVAVLCLVTMIVSTIVPMFAFTANAADTVITFTFGANGSASHGDGTSKTSYTETVGDYTLNITNVSSFYTGARDAKGNSAVKLGTSSKTGGFSFTVPSDVDSVIIYAAKYKTNTTKLSVNGTTHTLTNASADGAYDAITVDTSTTKTVTVTTVSGGVRCMINTIEFVIADNSGSDTPACECLTREPIGVDKDPTCTEPGSIAGEKCADCGAVYADEKTVPATGHDFVGLECTKCEATIPASGDAVISFASTSNRKELSESTQVWKDNGATLTNNKSGSTNPIADYSDPARFYKGSEIIIEAPGLITKIVFVCTSSDYASALVNSIGDGVSMEGTTVTLTPSSASTTYTIATLGAQIRMSSITVTYVSGEGVCTHENTTFVNYANGTHNFICDDCDEPVTVTNHNYVEDVCTMCGVSEYPVYTIPQANAAPDETKLALENVEVVAIKEAYSSQYNNVSLIVKDAEGNEFYCYRLKGNWNLGDVITVKGTKTTYKGIIEFAAGCTATLVSEGGFNVNAGAVQLLNGTTADSESTSARLVLTLTAADLAKLDNVGVYFSLDAGADATGFKKSTTTVFTSVNANGLVVEAANGTYYVLVEISDIPQANFGTTIYVRPFVTVDDAEYLGAEVSFSVSGILNPEA